MKKLIKTMLLAGASVGCLAGITACNEFKGLTINFWHTFGKTVEDAVKTYANKFASLVKENEGVDLRIVMTYKGGYDDVKGEVAKNFAIGDNPTITVAYPDHVADYFAAESTPGEYVVNLSNYVDNDSYGFGKEAWLGDTEGKEDFVPSFWEESTGYSKEGVYSIPFLKSTEVMLYNLNLVRKAMPYYDDSIKTDDEIREFMSDLSWNEFMEFCEAVKEHMVDISSSLRWPAFYDSDGNAFITQMYQRDIPYAEIDKTTGKAYIGFNGISETSTQKQKEAYDDTIDMLKEYKNWFDKGLIMTKGVDGEYSSNYFTPGQTIFAIGSSGGSGYSFPSTSEFEVACAKVPYSNDNAKYVSQGVTLCLLNNNKMIKAGTNADALKYGFKFIKYLTNPVTNAILCTNNSEGYMPVRQSAYSTPEFTRFMASQTEYVKVAKVVVNEINGNYFNSPVFKGSATLREQVGGAFADTLKLGKNPTDNQIKEILNRAINQTIIKM